MIIKKHNIFRMENFRSTRATILLAVIAGLTTPAATQTKGYANVNGIKLYYEIHGTGQPLVLLHGGFAMIEMFGSNLTELAKKHRVIAVDLQGHGRTADIDRQITPEFMADDIAALLKYLKIEKADIMGYSLGAMVALQTVIRHPELIRKAVIVSAPFKREGWYADLRAQQDMMMGPGAVEQLKQTPMYQNYMKLAPKPGDWPVFIEKMSKLVKQNYDWSKEVAAIKLPVMLVAGDADGVSLAHMVEFFGLLGGGKKDGGWDGSGKPIGRLAIIPNATHYDIMDTNQVLAVVIPFLD
jgi:pimeloyl-ACP methyl ester carboxylesterase